MFVECVRAPFYAVSQTVIPARIKWGVKLRRESSPETLDSRSSPERHAAQVKPRTTNRAKGLLTHYIYVQTCQQAVDARYR